MYLLWRHSVFLLFKGIASRMKTSVAEAKSLLDFYYSVGSLRLIKVTKDIVNMIHLSFVVQEKVHYVCRCSD